MLVFGDPETRATTTRLPVRYSLSKAKSGLYLRCLLILSALLPPPLFSHHLPRLATMITVMLNAQQLMIISTRPTGLKGPKMCCPAGGQLGCPGASGTSLGVSALEVMMMMMRDRLKGVEREKPT